MQRVARPTQRQSIDDETLVPADLCERMLRLGAEARARSAHSLAFRPVTGRPYLRRQLDDEAGTSAAGPQAAPLDTRCGGLATAGARAQLGPLAGYEAMVLVH
mmetsp:Transcript_69363/g.191914  ORF Transcript_69363/g.191914 Transcript_69363/m.191914 type:complete len:103 (-) Transcript_69363:84-392(-)